MGKLARRLLALCLGLALAEVMLHMAAAVSPRIRYLLSPPWSRVLVPDEVLGHRMSPLYPGNDSSGFRNNHVPDSCDVLTIGDSFTYGFGAGPREAWPQVLESLSGRSTYNMSCGAYSPVQYQVLLERGLRLSPSVVIIGITIVNDIAGSYVDVYGKIAPGRYEQFRRTDHATFAALNEAEQRLPFADMKNVEALRSVSTTQDQVSRAHKWLSEDCLLYALVRELGSLGASQEWPRVRESQQASFDAAGRRPLRFSYDSDPRFRTVFFDPEGEIRHVNLGDPRIQEGMRITEAILLSMQSTLHSRDIRFIVAVFPSKRFAYRELVENSSNSLPKSFFLYADEEGELIQELERFLQEHAIEYVNTTSALHNCFVRGERPFPESDDGHPNAIGYRAIAQALLPKLGDRQ